jgi:hypothetical protein
MTRLDIRHNNRDYDLYTRMIWETLFRKVHGERAKSLDSMLCDLKGFERLISDGIQEFWWYYDMDHSGYTNYTNEYIDGDRAMRVCYRIKCVPGQYIDISEERN